MATSYKYLCAMITKPIHLDLNTLEKNNSTLHSYLVHKDLSSKLHLKIFYYSIKVKSPPKSKKSHLVKDYQKVNRLKYLEDSGQKILGLSTKNKRIKNWVRNIIIHH